MGVVAAGASSRDILDYWRISLIDSTQSAPDATAANVDVEPQEIENGHLPAQAIARLFALKAAMATDQDDESDDVVANVALRTFIPEHLHTAAHTRSKPTCALGCTVRVTPKGVITPYASQTAPLIPRSLLAPSGQMQTIGQVAAVDRYLEQNPFNCTTWEQLLIWSDQFWQSITQNRQLPGTVLAEYFTFTPTPPPVGQNTIVNLKQFYDFALEEVSAVETPLLKGFLHGCPIAPTVQPEHRLAQLGAVRGTMNPKFGLSASQSDTMAAFSMLGHGQILAVNGPPGTGKTTLLQSVIATELVRRAIAGGEPAVIVGSSTNNQAVVNIIDAMTEALAAAGTAAWEQRWLPDVESLGLYFPSGGYKPKEGRQPFIAKDGRLLGTEHWQGFPAERERDPDYYWRAHAAWLEQFRLVYQSHAAANVSDAVEVIQCDIKALSARCAALAQAFSVARQSIMQHGGTRVLAQRKKECRTQIDTLTQQIAETTEQKALAQQQLSALTQSYSQKAGAYEATLAPLLASVQDAEAKLKNAKGTEARILAGLPESGFLAAFGAAKKWKNLEILVSETEFADHFLPLVREHSKDAQAWQNAAASLTAHWALEEEQRTNRYTLAKANPPAEIAALIAQKDAAQKAYEALNQKVLQAEQACVQATKTLQSSAQAEHLLAQLVAQLEQIFSQYGLGTETPDKPLAWHLPGWEETTASLDDLLDKTLRYEMFQKALRYWEGRWLNEVETLHRAMAGEEGVAYKFNTGRVGMETMYRRWCMLTPCLIMTTARLPRMMKYYQGREQYHADFIDLLIIDEAGQIPPYQAAPAFSFARKAIVVGDVFQLAPVVTLGGETDKGNAHSTGVYAEFWQEEEAVNPRVVTGLGDGRQTPGSVMGVVQSATAWSSVGADVPGMFLSEHRRCRKDIIQISNDLIYKGKLQPLRPEPAIAPPLPALGWAHVRGECIRHNGSSCNLKEADAIAEWIASNAKAWQHFYKKELDQLVAVITPFSAQKKAVAKALSNIAQKTGQAALKKITVGTVHALQGAERPIIIFSTVSDPQSGTGFLDSSASLMNVAVSRAKDSFVVIGNMDIMNPVVKTPLGILARALFERGQEVEGVQGNWTLPVLPSQVPLIERVSTPNEHTSMMDYALDMAQDGQQVLIVSPFLSQKGALCEAVVSRIKAAVQRGVEVSVVTQRWQRTNREEHQMCVEGLKACGAQCYCIDRIHMKTLAWPGHIAEGSYNWLSVYREHGGKANLDSSWKVYGRRAKQAIEAVLAELAERGVWGGKAPSIEMFRSTDQQRAAQQEGEGAQ